LIMINKVIQESKNYKNSFELTVILGENSAPYSIPNSDKP